MTFSDGSSEDSLAIDIYQDICTAATATSDAVMEDYTPTLANITVLVEDGMPGLTLNSYSIAYDPELSPDGSGASVMPPTLQNLTDVGSNNIHCPTGSSTEFSITCVSFDTKEEYASQDLVWDAVNSVWVWDIASARYTIRITLHFKDDSGASRDIVVKRTVYFYNVDNC